MASAGFTRATFAIRNTTVSAVTNVTAKKMPSQNSGP